MSSIALDGASVNIGKHRSVVKLCQNLNPAILPVHCFSHRLELAFWDTAKSVVTFKKVYTLLKGLYTFYHYSAKQKQLLIDTACKQKTECLIPTHASGTRWIAHWVTALQNMQRGYKTLVAQLSGLICNLQKKLTPGTDIVLQATNVANLIAWPENDSGIAAIRSFGNDEMTTVVEHYKEQLMFPSDEILEEWLTLKSILYRRYGKDIQNTR